MIEWTPEHDEQADDAIDWHLRQLCERLSRDIEDLGCENYGNPCSLMAEVLHLIRCVPREIVPIDVSEDPHG